MISFKGILKVTIYIFIAGWMFLLGIMVGRGTSPVTFDTEQFQKRLEIIAKEFGGNKKPDEKVDLQFYEVLDNPTQEESKPVKKPSKVTTKVATKEIVPLKEPDTEKNALKTSKKKETFKKSSNKIASSKEIPIKETPIKKSTKIQPVKGKDKRSENSKIQKVKAAGKKEATPGLYTIQIAAYKKFKDAVTQMASLDEKGFSSYRTKGEKDGITWYRVRTGDFSTYEDAKKFKLKLDKAKIKSMIIRN